VLIWLSVWSEVQIKWFVYGPADTTVTPSCLDSLKSRMVWPFWSLYSACFPGLSWERARPSNRCLSCFYQLGILLLFHYYLFYHVTTHNWQKADNCCCSAGNKVVIKNLQPGTTYLLRVSSRNEVGFGDYQMLRVTTKLLSKWTARSWIVRF